MVLALAGAATALLSGCAFEPYPPLPIPPQPEAVTYGSYLALPVPQEPQGPAPAFAHAPAAQGDVQLGVQPAPSPGSQAGSLPDTQPAPRAPVQPAAWRGDPAAFVGPPRPGARKLTIRLQRQRFEYSEGGRVVHSGEITSGSPEHPTPRGAYSILSKELDKRSGSYTNYFDRPTPMPYALQFNGPYYVHEGWVAGIAESHGCVRLHYEDARFVYERMRVGDRVAVVD
jgi:lipoprotein-anchoring transpeptidase ErfK/SrfK